MVSSVASSCLVYRNSSERTGAGVCYLSLITNAYSHMIVGWALGPTLETLYPLEALRMALSTIDNETAAMLMIEKLLNLWILNLMQASSTRTTNKC